MIKLFYLQTSKKKQKHISRGEVTTRNKKEEKVIEDKIVINKTVKCEYRKIQCYLHFKRNSSKIGGMRFVKKEYQ